MPVSDFRSDTVTRPTEAMRAAMASAEVGDDVFGDDPTARRLEEEVADRFGKEASLFVPSGVMGNLIAILVHTSPGDEVLLEEHAHSFHFETGGGAAFAGVQTRVFPSEAGIPDPLVIRDAIRPDNIHFPRTTLVVYENTNNIAGGRLVPLDVMRAVRDVGTATGAAVHVDGARIWHASVATGTPLRTYAAEADSVMCCLSKGLSAPVGSMLIGDGDFIAEARRQRKRLGGGMRQVGVLAAAGLVALEDMVERLAEDHARAKRLAEAFADVEGVVIDPEEVETNILIVRLRNPDRYDAVTTAFRERDVWVTNLWGRGIRLVTHRHIGDEDVARAIEALRDAKRASVF